MKINKLIYTLTLVLVVFASSCSEDTIEDELTGGLTGTVISSEDDMPLSNVKITTNPSSSTVFTDDNGFFSLLNIAIDDYSVMAELEGFDTAFEGAAVISEEIATVAFELDRASITNDPPSAPVLLTPLDGANDIESEVEFVWNSSESNATTLTYDLELRNAFTNEIENYSIEQDTTFTVSDLNLGATYFWQVTVDDGENPPVSSTISEFSTLAFPSNPFLFVKKEGDNSVIFSGGEVEDDGNTQVDVNLFQLTDDGTNSFRPRKNNQAQRIAFLRTVGGDTHIFTMDLTGENVEQVTSTIPVAGFRQDELDFTWSPNGDRLIYSFFDTLYSINPDGTGLSEVYQTTDGSFISEVDVQEFDTNLLLLKTNNINGYNVRIFAVNATTGVEEFVVLEGEQGAAGGAQISANGDKVLYSRDTSNSENPQYRIFSSRLFIYDVESATSQMLATDVITGENDLDPRFSPSEGDVIFTRVDSNVGAIPAIFLFEIEGNTINDDELFTNANMPDWE
ncbi:carboxypeptidase-like regulatory domain-containing protein [uncultured Dokdonia sp.]|uniref:carboxypeptidase-like regulatory domain-containing protein n=1 Tax=uncultured Dokdonia sp. TaxID=575653 RepID=UPI002604CAC6|nr:carboxypeptidase-like regulatory domain-containing protein [uncultured Dokdonia sp.]